jgi:peptide/nickel transport system permease protein
MGGLKSSDYDALSNIGKLIDMAWHLIIPATVLTIGGLAGLQRIMRGNMLEELRKQYITTARAKGLPEGRVIYRHALRNAINPMVTIFGFELSSLLSGAALLEIVLSYPGLGMVMYEAVRSQDLFLVMGSMLISGLMLIIGNLLADVLLAVVDPQVSYQ